MIPFFLDEQKRFHVTRQIAEGGMSRIFLAYDTHERAWRAIKVIRPELALRTDVRRRLKAEAETMARLRHKHILRVFEWEIRGDQAWLVTEYAERGSVGSWVDVYGAMPFGAALEVTRQLCDGVAYAHAEGVIHRDIKPHNVLVDGRGACLVADFGIAAIQDLGNDARMTTTGTTLGTLGYTAPEQLADARGVDGRADVYSIAATLAHLLAAKEPADLYFTGPSRPEIQALPVKLRELILRGSRRSAGDRFSSVAAVRDEVVALQAEYPPPPPEEFPLLAPPAPPPLPATFQEGRPAGPPTFDMDTIATIRPKSPE